MVTVRDMLKLIIFDYNDNLEIFDETSRRKVLRECGVKDLSMWARKESFPDKFFPYLNSKVTGIYTRRDDDSETTYVIIISK